MKDIPESFGSNSLSGLKTEGISISIRLRQAITVHTQYRKIPEDSQFQRDQIIRMHPIFGRLTDESTLITACASITLYRVTSSTNEVIELRELNNKGIPIILV